MKNVDLIIDIVSDTMNVARMHVTGKSRQKNIVYARHLCIYLIAETMPKLTDEKIAVYFGMKKAAVCKIKDKIKFQIMIYPTMRGGLGLLRKKIFENEK